MNWTLLLGAIGVIVGAFSVGWELSRRRIVRHIVQRWPSAEGQLGEMGIDVDADARRPAQPLWVWAGLLLFFVAFVYVAASAVSPEPTEIIATD